MKNTNITPQKIQLYKGKHFSAHIKLHTNFSSRFNAAQKIIDSAVLTYSAMYAPKKTGNLISGSFANTQVGSGKIVYPASYAKAQYYTTKTYRSYNSQRGALWFERMKLRHKNVILQSAANACGTKAVANE